MTHAPTDPWAQRLDAALTPETAEASSGRRRIRTTEDGTRRSAVASAEEVPGTRFETRGTQNGEPEGIGQSIGRVEREAHGERVLDRRARRRRPPRRSRALGHTPEIGCASIAVRTRGASTPRDRTAPVQRLWNNVRALAWREERLAGEDEHITVAEAGRR